MKVLDRNTRIAVTRPNWSSPVTVEYAFKTSMFTSRNGYEKREAMRENARVSVSFITALRKPGVVRHMQDMAESQTLPFTLPTRWRSAFLASPAAAAGDTFVLTETPFWCVPGARVVLTDEVVEEAFNVLTVVGQTVTVEGVLESTFPTGARVMAAYMARPAEQVEFEAVRSDVWVANVRYDVDPGTDPQPVPASTPVTFEGREVFLNKPNWRQGPRISFAAMREIVDSSRGVISVSSPTLSNARIETMGYNGMNAEETEDLIAFFLRHKGMRTGFFMPSWVDDISVAGVSAAAFGKLLVEGIEFKDAYENSTVYNVLIAFWPDGSYQVNRIDSMTLVGLDTELTMVDPWIAEMPSDIRVMFCHHWRFAADVLNVNWITNEASEMEFAVRTVQAGEND